MINFNEIWLAAIRNKAIEALFPFMVEIQASGGHFEITEQLEFIHSDIPDHLCEQMMETLNNKFPMVKWDE